MKIFHIRNSHIDEVNPHLLTIGNHVSIVGSCILTHDYSWSVVKTLTGQILGNQQPVNIGNNVFIGYGSIILGGTVIGDNVIIGAHSVVNGQIDADSVYAGVPAKKICTLTEYIQKRKERQLLEAKIVVQKYKAAHHALPPIEVMHEYFFLFTDAKSQNIYTFKHKLELSGNYEQSIEWLNDHTPMFANYEAFLEYCEQN